MNQYHILNGDALAERFPKDIKGERIVFRECLVDGPVASSLEQLFALRAPFMRQHYEADDYSHKAAKEIAKIETIGVLDEVYLWFEEDLFCQVNLWFLVHYFAKKGIANLSLVHPEPDSPYAFSTYDEAGLQGLFQQRQKLHSLDQWMALWQAYQQKDHKALQAAATHLATTYPFVTAAVQANIDRVPKDDALSRPLKSLQQIKAELQTDDFAPIFRAFCQREAIYGFGDLQVERLLQQLEDVG